MTKRRAPLTFELALTKIAALIGWDNAAAIVGQAERTVRNWSDPDTSARITLDSALALDVAYAAAGGEGSPMHECFTARLKAERAEACAGAEALARSAAETAKESGEANAALFAAIRPGATDTDLLLAERELEESISASTNTLATLRAGRRGDVSSPGGASK